VPLRALVLVLAAAVATAGCGSSSGSGAGRSSPAPSSGSTLAAPASAHAPTTTPSVQSICRTFTHRLAIGPFSRNFRAVTPADAPALFAELEGLSRRLEFAPASPARQVGLRRLAALFDRAAITSQALGRATTPATAAGPLARLYAQLTRSNALATSLGLRDCRMSIRR